MYLESIISGYTRRQAIDDGLLIPLSGPDSLGRFGDWVQKMVHEAGFGLPLLITHDAFDDCVFPLDDSMQLDPSQNASKRLAKVLKLAAKTVRGSPGKSSASFRISVRGNIRKGAIAAGQSRNLTLSIEAIEGEDNTYLVIMRPRER